MQHLFLNDPTIWVLISFCLFVVLAFALGRKTAIGILDEKIEKIKSNIQSAERLKSEAEALMLHYKNNLTNAANEADSIIAKAHAQARDIRAKADQDFQETMNRREALLKNRIEQMERAAIDDIRRYAAELAISATTEIISQKLSSDSASRLLDQSIDQISEKLN